MVVPNISLLMVSCPCRKNIYPFNCIPVILLLYTFTKEKDATPVIICWQLLLSFFFNRVTAMGFECRSCFMGRGLQAMKARVRMLRRLTTETRSNLVLSDGLTLESLVPITRNLDDAQLEQWVINAIRNAAYRIMMEVPHLEDLPEVIIITKADFQLALTDLNA
jgi:hypothetical protein